MIKATYIDHCGSDLTTVNAARVSFGKKSEWGYNNTAESMDEAEALAEKFNGFVDTDCIYSDRWMGGYPVQYLKPEDKKLIHYLAKHKHYSPFGHCFASFHIKAPIFVARQLVKHEYLRMNEISRRYVDSEPEFYVPDVWRGRSKDKKQGSDGVVTNDVPLYAVEAVNTTSIKWYDSMLEAGVAPEMARMVLPQSMYTEWYWSGSMDAFANMCALRLKEDTQYETRLVAQQIDTMMAGLFPVSWKALVHGG